jgi:hypothetical protein
MTTSLRYGAIRTTAETPFLTLAFGDAVEVWTSPTEWTESER